MSDLKPELSVTSEYWIPKDRYYELKHYCLQYPDWKKLYFKLDGDIKVHPIANYIRSTPADPTGKIACIRADLKRAIDLVDNTARDSSAELGDYILKAVTEGIPFVQLQMISDIPCGKDMYYASYRKFFYLLSQRKGI